MTNGARSARISHGTNSQLAVVHEMVSAVAPKTRLALDAVLQSKDMKLIELVISKRII